MVSVSISFSVVLLFVIALFMPVVDSGGGIYQSEVATTSLSPQAPVVFWSGTSIGKRKVTRSNLSRGKVTVESGKAEDSQSRDQLFLFLL